MPKNIRAVVWMTLSGGLTYGGYKLVRSSADSLFLEEFGSARLPYFMAAIPIAVALAMGFYSFLLSRLRARWTLPATFGLTILAFISAYGAIRLGIPYVTGPLYILKEIYIVLLIVQHWSFVVSVLSEAQAKKVNSLILGSSALMAYLIGTVTQDLPKIWGASRMLPLAGLLMVPAAFCSMAAFRCVPDVREDATAKAEKFGDYFGLRRFRLEPAILWLGLVIFAMQVTTVFLELTFYEVVQKAVGDAQERASFFVRFWNRVDLAGFLCAFLVTPVLLRFFRLKWIHAAIPTALLLSALLLWHRPTLAFASFAFFLLKTLQYNVFDPAKEVLYIPLSFESRYRAKQLIDSVIYRTTKGVTSLAVASSSAVFGTLQAVRVYPPLAALFLLGWLVFVRKLFSAGPKGASCE